MISPVAGGVLACENSNIQKEISYFEIVSPILAKPETAEGTAHLPKFDKDMYKTREGFYLIPTAEVPVTNLARDEILDANDLPVKLTLDQLNIPKSRKIS